MVSSSTVIGASRGTSGTSHSTTRWRRTAETGSSTPAGRVSNSDNGPAATTAAPVAIVPWSVTTAVSRPDETSNPVTPTPVITSADEPSSRPIAIRFGSIRPSPWRKRACTTSSGTQAKRLRASSPVSSSTPSTPHPRWRSTS